MPRNTSGLRPPIKKGEVRNPTGKTGAHFYGIAVLAGLKAGTQIPRLASIQPIRKAVSTFLSEEFTTSQLKKVIANPKTPVHVALCASAVARGLRTGDVEILAKLAEIATGEKMLLPDKAVQVNIQNNIQQSGEYDFSQISDDILFAIADKLQDGKYEREHPEEVTEC